MQWWLYISRCTYKAKPFILRNKNRLKKHTHTRKKYKYTHFESSEVECSKKNIIFHNNCIIIYISSVLAPATQHYAVKKPQFVHRIFLLFLSMLFFLFIFAKLKPNFAANMLSVWLVNRYYFPNYSYFFFDNVLHKFQVFITSTFECCYRFSWQMHLVLPWRVSVLLHYYSPSQNFARSLWICFQAF